MGPPLLQLFLTILILLIASTIVLPIIAIALVLRKLISLWAIYWDPDIDSPIVGNDAVYALRDRSIRGGFIIYFLVLENGTKDTVYKLREMFAQTLMCQPELYKRLWHFFATFGGFAFWKRDRRFCISNHIRDYDLGAELELPAPFYFEDLPKLAARLQRVELPPERSPWEFLVIRKVLSRKDPTSAPKTILLLRIDHVLADGISTVSAARCLFNAECTHASPSESSSGGKNNFLSCLTFIFIPFKCAHDYAYFLLQFWNRKPALPRSNSDSRVSCGMSNRICFDDIKKIRSKYGVSITNALHAINVEATVRSLKETDPAIPANLSTSILWPLPNRPKRGLGTYMTGTVFVLTTESGTSVQRLYSVDRQLKEQSRTTPTMPLVMGFIISACSNLPVFCIQALVSYFTDTADIPLSTFPLLTLPEKVAGLRCTEVIAFLPAVAYGIQGISLGSNGQLRYTYTMKDVFSVPDFIERLCCNVENVLNELLHPTD